MTTAPNATTRTSLLALGLATLIAGCGGTDDHAGHDHDDGHKHEHRPPHGGTPVVLGREAFHLELVRTAETGVLTCYVLDGHMESFVRIPAPGLPLEATISNRVQTLELKPVPNAATGEKAGDTSQFEAKADWLKTTTNFTGRIPALTVRGVTFTNVTFRFPEGNE